MAAPILNQGIYRLERLVQELYPGFVPIDERSITDLLKHAELLAERLDFFRYKPPAANAPGLPGKVEKDGDWSELFSNLSSAGAQQLGADGSMSPHQALYLAFLYLFQHAQRQLNDIGRRHLEYHYGEVLGMARRQAKPDKAHVLFEMKKGSSGFMLGKGTQLLGGKDDEGKLRVFGVDSDTPIIGAQVAELRALYVDPNTKYVHISPLANSADGVGGRLDEGASWSTFGDENRQRADIGFAVSSQILRLAEGNRTITVQMKLSGQSEGDLPAFIPHLTSSSGWITKEPVSLEKDTKVNNQCNLKVTLEQDEEAIVDYNSELHGGNYDTAAPILQFVLVKSYSHTELANLSGATVDSVQLEVHVQEAHNLEIATDFGNVDPAKQFQPFGPQARKGARMYIKYPEALSKDPTELKLQIDWLQSESVSGATSWSGYYASYGSSAANFAWKAGATVAGEPCEDVLLLETEEPPGEIAWTHEVPLIKASETIFIVPNYQYRQLWNLIGAWASRLRLEMSMVDSKTTRARAKVKAEPAGAKDQIVLELLQDSLTDKYRDLYTAWVIANNPQLSPPPLPYIPVIKSINLDYKAKTDPLQLNSEDRAAFLQSEVAFYHVGAFGQARRHAFLYEQLGFPDDKLVRLLPPYDNEGELYIGMTNIQPGDTVSLLFALDEGSSDPDLDKADVEWSVLCDNVWHRLDVTEVLADDTRSLLQSGLVRISTPFDASLENTLLPMEKLWLRASVATRSPAVCDMIGVHADAALCTRILAESSTEYTGRSLPAGTIKQLQVANASVKSISQPYMSFGGTAAEADSAFYVRVAERCRHKQRSVDRYDIEHMVLEQFPEVYKVKCINHTSAESELAAGHVTVVVVPDPFHGESRYPLRPRLNKATLEAIWEMLQGLATVHAEYHVQNPVYAEVELSLDIQFRNDFRLCRARLEKEINSLLAPWAYRTTAEIDFGGSLHRSEMIHYIERLSYVDYLANLEMLLHRDDKPVENSPRLEARGPREIFTSYGTHDIRPIDEDED